MATTLVYRSLQDDSSWTPRNLADFDICTSFITLYMDNSRVRRVILLTSETLTLIDSLSTQTVTISKYLWGAFAASCPLAIMLRKSGRQALYLPMNILQRVLIGLVLYSEWAVPFRNMRSLHGIQDRAQVAATVRRVFGSTLIDGEIAQMRELLKVLDVFDP